MEYGCKAARWRLKEAHKSWSLVAKGGAAKLCIGVARGGCVWEESEAARVAPREAKFLESFSVVCR